MKIRQNLFLVLLFVILFIRTTDTLQIRKFSHKKWSEDDRKLSEITDITWNYCDVKCTYLEILFPAHDFVVIYFENTQSHQKFGACYIRIKESYFLWSQLVHNDFYFRTCGQQNETDYYKDHQTYRVVSMLAMGKGNQLPQKYTAY